MSRGWNASNQTRSAGSQRRDHQDGRENTGEPGGGCTTRPRGRRPRTRASPQPPLHSRHTTTRFCPATAGEASLDRGTGTHAGGRRARRAGPDSPLGGSCRHPGKPPRPRAAARLIGRVGERRAVGPPERREGGPKRTGASSEGCAWGPGELQPPPAARTPGLLRVPPSSGRAEGRGRPGEAGQAREPAKAVAEAAAGERCGKAPPRTLASTISSENCPHIRVSHSEYRAHLPRERTSERRPREQNSSPTNKESAPGRPPASSKQKQSPLLQSMRRDTKKTQSTRKIQLSVTEVK